MTPTQTHLLKLLLEIDSICKKYDIQYFVDYGSALGAIRHEGFIPWDDDIDITMTEDNYYKWIDACAKELDSSKRIFKDVRMDREYPLVFGRYIDVENARISPKFEFWKAESGQCIDVFYLIELPPDSEEKNKAIDLYFAYDEYSNSSFRHARFRSENVMSLYKKFCEEEKRIGKNAVLEKLEKQIFHKHYDKCDTYLVSSARKLGAPSVVPKEYYDSVFLADFEGYKLPIAGKYVELMNYYYEDTFCMLPDDQKRHMDMSHTGIPCEGYLTDYMQLLDKESMLKARQDFKHMEVEEGYRMTRIRQMYFSKLGSCEVLKIKRKIRENNIDIKEYLVPDDKDKLAVLDNVFSDYYKWQTNKSVRYWDVPFDMDDDLLYAALFNLLYGRNDFYSIAKIIQLKKQNEGFLSPEVSSIWEIVLLYRKIRAEIIYKNYEKARAYLIEGMKKAPYCRQIQIEDLVLDVALAKNDKDYEDCINKAQLLIEKYPDDDTCMKMLGDIALERGELDKAREYYSWVMHNSKNGMFHLDIKKKRERLNE